MCHFTLEVQIETDASAHGWGAQLNTHRATGTWDYYTSRQSSDFRELTAVWMALKSFAPIIKNKSVQILSDNITTVSYLNNLGGSHQSLSMIAEMIYVELIQLNVKLNAKYLAGNKNTRADIFPGIIPSTTGNYIQHYSK